MSPPAGIPEPRSRPGPATLAAVALGGAALWLSRGTVPLAPLALQLATVLVLLALGLAAVGLGDPVARLLPGLRELEGPARWPAVLAVGAAGLMACAGMLAAGGLLAPLPLAVAGAAAVLSGLWVLRRHPPGVAPIIRNAPPVPSALVVLAGAVTLPVLAAFLPAYDTLNYHLGMPWQWLRAGTLVVFPRDVYSLQPSNVGLLATWALALAGPWAAQAVHWWLGGLTLAGTAALAGGDGGPEAAPWWTAALLATTPAFLMVATLAYSDLGVTAFAAAGWLLLVHAAAGPPMRGTLLVVAGTMAGLALGCKYTAGPTVVVPLLGAAVLAGPAGRRVVARLLDGCRVLAGTLVAFSPWAIRNLVVTGNPIYPYLDRLWATVGLGSPGSAAVSSGLGSFPGPLPSLERVLSLGALGIPGHGGLVGSLYLALLPATVWFAVTRWRADARVRALAVGSLLAWAGWLAGPPLGRYLLGGLVPLAALTGLAVAAALARTSRGVAVMGAAALLFVGLWYVTGSLGPDWPRRMAVALGQENPEVLLERYASSWPAVAASRDLPDGSTILLVAESRPMYWARDVVVEDPFHTPLVVELAEESSSVGEMARGLRALGVTHVYFNGVEARRIARMNGRAEYFGEASRAARQRLDRFFERWLRPVWSDGRSTLYALEPPGPQSGS